MKLLSSLCAVSVLAAAAGLASADTLTLASYGTTAAAPAGVSNTATAFQGALVLALPPVVHAGPTYDLPTGGVWAAPTGLSSWVGINPGDYPGGNHVEPNGVYTYTSTFNDFNAANSSGQITVLADDTTSVFLNGTELIDAASFFDPGAHCTEHTPNCVTPVTINLAGFLNGTNTLTFKVNQDYGSATGLDFSGSVNVTPEPSSLLLMGSGLLGMGGMVRRRRVQA